MPREDPAPTGSRSPFRVFVVALLLALPPAAAAAGSLDGELGRNEVRVRSAPFRPAPGATVVDQALPARLERLGYRRVHERPDEPGEYFWGRETFWVYRRAHRWGGRERPALLFGLVQSDADGRITGATLAGGKTRRLEKTKELWLEPELIAESLRGDRAVREPVRLDDLPEHVWRSVLAAEDARFFDHVGLDGRALARAMLANAKAGEVRQGGSTITQQLIKNRDLSARRSLGRKASEAVRALALEAEYEKREILQAYLDQLYLGHVEGLAVHGLGTAARTYFSKRAAELTLAEAALLAGMIQGPNRLTPLRHPERARQRRDWVLERMEELGWAGPDQIAEARRDEPAPRLSSPRRPPAPWFLDWIAAQVERHWAERLERGRGFVVETTLDPLLQSLAERAVEKQLDRLRRANPSLGGRKLSAVLVALDGRTGETLAYVGGDPADGDDRYDRARRARRQPGSSIKPLLLLEAFQDCGERRPLSPATRVADEPLRIDLPSGPWEPENYDGRYSGVVDLRTALRRSLNVPFVRVSRWCGEQATARRMRRAGLALPDDPPPSFALGAVETTPLELAGAYTVFASPGRASRPLSVRRVERPSGRTLEEFEPRRKMVVHSATAYLVRDLMRDAVERGTGTRAAIDGVDVAGKTGTARDAWFAGDAGGIVAVAWVGAEDGKPLGLGGSRAAAPLWKAFMQPALSARPRSGVERPRDIVERRVDPKTGLLLPRHSRKGQEELFRRQALPRKDHWLKRDPPEPVLR
jgi:penicillin-binding protein 1B